ncbi:hypothetical protein Golax_021025 [Gossypium laxum]|uniref:Serine-threonine/tyrosine-protein kinase catalytic domain-containing protein n=1 Tax=Gossypium laxum TaxID=34288 RepID=A0A7J9AJQ7_9ROSI|nr:hypothetical protein [Gossypium laxum]
MRGHLTEKADIFAFGIVALEILSGRPNSDNSLEDDKIYLLEWSWALHENNQILDLVDPNLVEFDENEVLRVVRIALLCTQGSPSMRPPMSRVVAMLAGDIEASGVITKPSYLTDWDFRDLTRSLVTKDAQTSTSSENKDNHNQNRISSGPGVAPSLCPVNVSEFSEIIERRLDYLIGWRAVAVKQLSIASNWGKSKFIAEVTTISAVQHRNLVKLQGYCIVGKRHLLVHEYLENNSLDQALFGRFPASENNDSHNRNRISSSPGAAPILSPVNVSDFSDITEGRQKFGKSFEVKMGMVVVISLPLIIFCILLGTGCFFFGRAKGRQDFRTNPQVYGVPAPPPGVPTTSFPSPPHTKPPPPVAATTSFPSPPHTKPDNLANV